MVNSSKSSSQTVNLETALVTNKDNALFNALDLARTKLQDTDIPDISRVVLILLDADNDAPCELGPHILELARSHHSDQDVSCVIAKMEYETWFVASASSLQEDLAISVDDVLPDDPNRRGWAKPGSRSVFEDTTARRLIRPGLRQE